MLKRSLFFFVIHSFEVFFRGNEQSASKLSFTQAPLLLKGIVKEQIGGFYLAYYLYTLGVSSYYSVWSYQVNLEKFQPTI